MLDALWKVGLHMLLVQEITVSERKK